MTLEDAREIIKKNHYPPKFDPDSWKEQEVDANCYSYALNLKISEAFLIGDFIGKRVTNHFPDDELLLILVEELMALGFEVKEVDTQDNCPSGSFKIYLARHDDGYYHFIRQDEDGIWSHKATYFLPHRRDSAGELLTDPDTSCSSYVVGWCFQLTKKEQ